jgi:hypothetical protein
MDWIFTVQVRCQNKALLQLIAFSGLSQTFVTFVGGKGDYFVT